MKVDFKLALVVSVTDENGLLVFLHLQDLVARKAMNIELLPNHIIMWFMDGGQVDEKWNGITICVVGPEVVLQVSVECRFAGP